jgi:hypothetical protein
MEDYNTLIIDIKKYRTDIGTWMEQTFGVLFFESFFGNRSFQKKSVFFHWKKH